MNRTKLFLFVVTLALIAGTAGLLGQLRSYQRLGKPGVKTQRLPDSNRLQVFLPEKVLDYQSESVDIDEVTQKALPQDTSFGQRRYTAPDGFVTLVNVVLMGADRTSLHKPQFCLEGQGWHIDKGASAETKVPIIRPSTYDLPVIKLVTSKQVEANGQTQTARGLYVYWFVADNALSGSASGMERVLSSARQLVHTGVLQRWAYVSCFAVCAPGQEDATFERMKLFIAAATPEFQLTPRESQAIAASH
jgi:hypothetical protein